MQKYEITFELDDKDQSRLLHEMLCKAIHEQNKDALDWLLEHTLDIRLTKDTTHAD
jgi:hypothetical protein